VLSNLLIQVIQQQRTHLLFESKPTLEISMDHRHLLTLLENSTMKYLSPSYGMVSGLHTVLTSDWCAIIHLIIHLTNNHGSLQKV